MRSPLRRLPRGARVVVDWVGTIVFAVAIVLAVKTWVANPYRIPSSSMEPTLLCAAPGHGCSASVSDRVLANRFVYHLRKPRRGDVVVFRTPASAARLCGEAGTYVKRLVALPGETWEERDGYVYIDGKRLDEPYVKEARRDVETHALVRIPAGSYFFMGDNRSLSCDSRKWGTVPRKDLIGQVFATYWPPSRLTWR
jgi:signal peptidase I